MNDRTWKNISIMLGVICALLFGVAGALLVVGGKGGAQASSGPDSSIVSEATPTATPVASGSTNTGQPTPSGSGTIVVTPLPVTGPGDPATITFSSLALDAAKDVNGTLRTWTFTSDGPGPVTFAVTKISKQGTAKMCIKVDSGTFACKVGTLVNFLTAKADPGQNTWTMTLQGYGTSAPVVDVVITFPAVNPKITFNHGRLQGSSSPGISESTNGFTATFKPRKAGNVSVQASWTTITTDVQMTLLDVTSPPIVTVDQRTFKSVNFINPAYSSKVDPSKTYQVKLRDLSADSQRPDLTAEISFP